MALQLRVGLYAGVTRLRGSIICHSRTYKSSYVTRGLHLVGLNGGVHHFRFQKFVQGLVFVGPKPRPFMSQVRSNPAGASVLDQFKSYSVST